MMSSAFLQTLLGAEEKDATPASSLRELGRFTLSSAKSAPVAAATPALVVGSSAAKQAAADAKRSYALLLSALPNDTSTLVAFNYSRAGVAEYSDLTQALFAQVSPKRVLLLDTLHHGSFLSAIRPLPCPPLLRRLQTSALVQPAAASADSSNGNASASSVVELEAPNLVHSYAAAVLTHVRCNGKDSPAWELPCARADFDG
jgi:hypothetical protein